MSDVVTIVVPVFRGLDDVRRCLDSVERHGRTATVPSRLVVIDDDSPEPEVSAWLDAVPRDDLVVPVEVLRNPKNLGFVASVNRGIEQAEGDVVVLNADTVVTEGWLDRLHDAAQGAAVATVTPLSGSGSIATLPRSVVTAFGLDGDDPRADECAAFVAEHSLRLRPEVVTGVGFCMYVRADALAAVGPFDVAAFGRGYGEEVDLCLRASRLGFRHLVEDATFVHHRGGGSFGGSRAQRMAAASTVLHRRYRWFGPVNRRERVADPLAPTMRALELALAPAGPPRPTVLHLLHGDPDVRGGTEQHLRKLIEALGDVADAAVLYPVEDGFVLRERWLGPRRRPYERELLLPGPGRRAGHIHDEVAAAALEAALDLVRPAAVHVHNLIRHSLAPLEVLQRRAYPVVCTVHDLYLACPHHWLLYENVEACGIPDDLDLCRRCLPVTADLDVRDLRRFRSTVASGLDAVDRWILPTRSAGDHLARVYDIDPDRTVVVAHGALVADQRPSAPDVALIDDEPLRIGFVGLGWNKKGLDIADHLAASLAHTSIEVHHFGELRGDASDHLRCHGPYEPDDLAPWLQDAGIQVALLPGPYAETFSQVVSELLLAGLPVIGAGYGAVGERIRATGAGWTFDPAEPAALVRLVQDLDEARWEVLRATRAALAAPVPDVAGMAATYADLYGITPPGGDMSEEDR